MTRIRVEFFFSIILNAVHAMPTSTTIILPKMLGVKFGFENFKKVKVLFFKTFFSTLAGMLCG